jgi:hypothetical protein
MDGFAAASALLGGSDEFAMALLECLSDPEELRAPTVDVVTDLLNQQIPDTLTIVSDAHDALANRPVDELLTEIDAGLQRLATEDEPQWASELYDLARHKNLHYRELKFISPFWMADLAFIGTGPEFGNADRLPEPDSRLDESSIARLCANAPEGLQMMVAIRDTPEPLRYVAINNDAFAEVSR